MGYSQVIAGTYSHSLTQCLQHMRISGKSNLNRRLLKWFPSGGTNGSTRFFQLLLGDGQHAFKVHGLGGCSLVNAGVFLEADEETLSMRAWPPEIRDCPAALQQCRSHPQKDRYSVQLTTLRKIMHVRLKCWSHRYTPGTRLHQGN
jgi:hypothetical protein